MASTISLVLTPSSQSARGMSREDNRGPSGPSLEVGMIKSTDVHWPKVTCVAKEAGKYSQPEHPGATGTGCHGQPALLYHIP